MKNTRCAFVCMATATEVRPARRGKPPPAISRQVMPLSVDFQSDVPVRPVSGCGPRPGGAPGATKCRTVVAKITSGTS